MKPVKALILLFPITLLAPATASANSFGRSYRTLPSNGTQHDVVIKHYADTKHYFVGAVQTRTNGATSTLVKRLDADGLPQVTRQLDGIVVKDFVIIGHYLYVIGEVDAFEPLTKALGIYCLDLPNLVPVWFNHYAYEQSSLEPAAAVESKYETFAVSGTISYAWRTDRDFWVGEFTHDGEVLWQRAYDHADAEQQLYLDEWASAIDTHDGLTFVVAGTWLSEDQTPTEDGWAIKLNCDDSPDPGSVIDYKNFTSGDLANPRMNESIADVKVIDDHFFVVTGRCDEFLGSQQQDIWVSMAGWQNGGNSVVYSRAYYGRTLDDDEAGTSLVLTGPNKEIAWVSGNGPKPFWGNPAGLLLQMTTASGNVFQSGSTTYQFGVTRLNHVDVDNFGAILTAGWSSCFDGGERGLAYSLGYISDMGCFDHRAVRVRSYPLDPPWDHWPPWVSEPKQEVVIMEPLAISRSTQSIYVCE